jgi:Zn-dependent M28 family amino/carboxypeptidase
MRRAAYAGIAMTVGLIGVLLPRAVDRLSAAGPPGSLPAFRAGLPPNAEAAMNTIDAERLRAHTLFLGSDLLEGRYPGERGGEIATQYVATQFALLGLQPGGDAGSYLQKIPMVFMKAQPSSQLQFVPKTGAPIPLKFLDDVVVQNETQTETADVDAPIVFVGYGIDAPEFKWDDYKGLDVRGKVLLMFAGQPPQTLSPTKGLTWYYKWTYKWDEAATKGAVGAIIINRQDMSSADWLWIQNTHGHGRTYLKYDQTPKVKAAAWVQRDMGRKLLASAGKDLDQMAELAKTPEFRPIELPVTFKAHVVSKVHRFNASNVVALVPGTDPRLKDEAVLYTAHWDHLGIVPEKTGDNVYNGARDNATGTASLLEIARAFATAAVRPARTIVLVADAAEEQGMIGVEYLSKHPPGPARNIIVNLNYDGQAPLGDAAEVRVGGAEQTDFLPQVESLATRFNMSVAAPPGPGGGCCRSDVFWLNSVGIPSFSMGPGKFVGPSAEWITQQTKVGSDCYHQPCDEYREDWDFRGPARVARYGFALGWQAATQPKAVEWKPGAEYARAKKKPMFCAWDHLCP